MLGKSGENALALLLGLKQQMQGVLLSHGPYGALEFSQTGIILENPKALLEEKRKRE